MEPNPPALPVSGQREVAVIMFTDAVSFSARVHEQEVSTLHRLERDIDFMRRACATYAGDVLKSTGDGLLVQFASAVQAVTCAVEIQRGFATRTVSRGESAPLKHRIGVHLGDVFVSEGDLMGDGVNIAARLMGEASPGGIIISRLVYDLVKNKLSLNVQHLGPRQLKNIREPVDMIRVLAEPPRTPPAPAGRGPAATSAVPATPEPVQSRRPLMVLLGIVVLAALAFGIWRAQEAHEQGLAESQSAQARLDALLRKQNAGQTRGAQEPVDVPAGEVRTDFAALVSSMPATVETHGEKVVADARAEEALLLAWIQERLASYTPDRPLVVRSLGDPLFAGTSLYRDSDGALQFVEGRAHRRREWQSLPRAAQGAIIVAVLRDSVQPPPLEIRRAAEAFAFLHGQPAMLRK